MKEERFGQFPRTAVDFSIVVPFFNEVDNIKPLYESIVKVMDALGHAYEMVFVDDGSRDGSYKILREISDRDARVALIRLRRNFGQTAALKAGFDYTHGEIIVSMDGDLQHDPTEIPQFINKILEGYDIVSGWRVDRKDAWLTRRIPSRIANRIMAKLSRVELHDFGTTFKAYRREVVTELQLYGDLHRFIPALASWQGANIAEIPIKNIQRKNGKSNYNISRTLRVLLDLISVKFLLDYSTRPLHFFGTMGLLSGATGLVIAFVLLLMKLLTTINIMDAHGPLLVFASVLILAGVQLLALGLLGEMQVRHYYAPAQRAPYSVAEVLRSSENQSAIS